MATYAPTVPRFAGSVFVFFCVDGPNAETLRAEHLAGHLEHVERHHDRFILAGPMRPPGQLETDGSLFLMIAESEQEAWALMREDPYVTSGLYERIDMRQMTPSLGQWMGGVIWQSVEEIAPFATRARTDDELPS